MTIRVSLRRKLSFGSLIISFLISLIFGVGMYLISVNLFFNDFLSNKLSIVKLCAQAIDGNIHRNFRDYKNISEPEYQRYFNFLYKIKEQEDYIGFLYTLNYDEELDTVYYSIDADKMDYDTVWIESEEIAMYFFLDDNKKPTIGYNDILYKESFTITLDKKDIKVIIKESEVFLDNTKILTVINTRPLIVETESGRLFKAIRSTEKPVKVMIGDVVSEFWFSFTGELEPISDPGIEYIDNEDSINLIKKLFKEEKDYIYPKPVITNYGEILSAYSIIRDNSGNVAGLMGMDIFIHEITSFKNRILLGALAISFLIMIMIFIIALILAHYITTPLNRLLDSVNTVAEGDLDEVISINRDDEFGNLADHFNIMVHNIKRARNKLTRFNDSISRFVPREFLQFLHKEDIVSVERGDNVEKSMVILFSDIRSFTSLSEQMTPDENFNFINDYLGVVGPVVRKYSGFIDKYIGDAIMALFPGDVSDSINASILMFRALDEYNRIREVNNKEPINIGIGLHRGKVMLGILGEENRIEGTVISDTVNVASRLEGLTKNYDASILISDELLQVVKDRSRYKIRYIDRVRVKGKTKPMKIYEILDARPEKSLKLKLKILPYYRKGISEYYKKNFDEALKYFKYILKHDPTDKPAAIFFKRIKTHQLEGVSDDWDGTVTLTSK